MKNIFTEISVVLAMVVAIATIAPVGVTASTKSPLRTPTVKVTAPTPIVTKVKHHGRKVTTMKKWHTPKFPSVVTVSWYGSVYEGRKTSSGVRFHPEVEFTAANRTLPFGTLVKITYAKTGKSVTVRITDRGPMNPKWEFDLSSGAAKEVGLLRDGVGKVTAEIES